MPSSSYHIRVYQGEQIGVLSFPQEVESNARDLFQDYYERGRAFISDLQKNQREMFHILRTYYSPEGKRFGYDVMGDVLNLKPIVPASLYEIEGDNVVTRTYRWDMRQNDINSMVVMSGHHVNYLHLGRAVIPDRPVTIFKTHDERIDQNWLDRGKPGIEELLYFLGLNDEPEELKYVKLDFIQVPSN